MKLFYIRKTTLLAVAVLLTATASSFADLDSLINFKPKGGYRQLSPAAERFNNINSSDAYILEQDELLSILQEQVQDEYNPDGRLVLYPLQKWGGLKLPSSAWDLELIKLPGGVLSSRFNLKFKITEHGQTLGRWQLPVACEVWKRALISNKQVNANTPLNPGDFAVQEIDILREKKGVISANIDIRKYEAKRSISSNRPLYWRDATPRSMVGKGEMVSVVATQGKLMISMHALALEDGAYGDVINLRNKDSNKRIQAEVIDENKVRIFL